MSQNSDATPGTQESTDPNPTDSNATVDVSAADESTEETTPDPGTDALGDPGKKALDSMKSKWHSERDKRRELEARLEALEAPKVDDSGAAPDAAEIKRQATREANAKANARIIRSEIKAAAAGKLADPSDALAYLDPTKFELNDAGDVDADELSEAIADLISRKPYLAATGQRPRFQDSGDGGAARKASSPSQLSRDDLKRMSPEAIVKARSEGRLKDVMGG